MIPTMPYCSNCGHFITNETMNQNQGWCNKCIETRVIPVDEVLEEIRGDVEWATRLEGRMVNLDQEIQKTIPIITEIFTKLAVCGHSINHVLSQTTIEPVMVNTIQTLFKEALDLIDQVIPPFNSMEPLVKDLVKICSLVKKSITTVPIVIGVTEGFGWDSSHNTISNSDLVKKEFFYFQEGIFPEIVQRLTPYLTNSTEKSTFPTELGDGEFIGAFRQFVDTLVLLGKHIHPNLLYDKKLKMMKLVEQRAQILTKLLQPFEKFSTNQYLKSTIQKASDKFAVFVGPNEFASGKPIKLSGFFGTKEEIDLILKCCKKMMELGPKNKL